MITISCTATSRPALWSSLSCGRHETTCRGVKRRSNESVNWRTPCLRARRLLRRWRRRTFQNWTKIRRPNLFWILCHKQQTLSNLLRVRSPNYCRNYRKRLLWKKGGTNRWSKRNNRRVRKYWLFHPNLSGPHHTSRQPTMNKLQRSRKASMR